jgi:hypothetical protein
MDLDNLYALYQQNKRNAEKRRIAYRLTFKQWLDAWGSRILDEHRGAGDDRLRLERIDKAGCFEVGNVHVVRGLLPGELRSHEHMRDRQRTPSGGESNNGCKLR